MNDVMDKIKNTRILAAIGIAGLLLGTFFPYFRISFWGYTTTISLWNYWEGKIVLLLALANLLFLFKDVVEKYAPGLFKSNLGKKISSINNPKVALVPIILSVVFLIFLHAETDMGFNFEYFGLGFYLLWLGAISIVAYAILHRNDIGNVNVNNNSEEQENQN